MFRNYLLTSIRALWRTKTNLFLNLLGLTMGVSACLLCYLHIRYELSFDSFFPKEENIHRVVTGNVKGGEGWVKVSAPIPPKLKEEIPEVENFARLTRFNYNDKVSVAHERTVFNEANFFMTDPAFLQMFDIQMLSGDRQTTLQTQNAVIISRSTAQKYFGNSDPVGEILQVDGKFDFEVTAVFEDLPHNSHLDLDLLISFENLERIIPGTSLTGNWGQFNYFAYVLLHSGSDPARVESKIKEITVDIGQDEPQKFEDLGLQALRDIHFEANRGNEKPSYDPRYLYFYTAIALAILFISFINFVNLTMAASTRRLKEVGVRKVVGATRRQLITQFISEGLIVSTISVGLALIVSQYVLLPWINEVIGSNIMFTFSPALILAIVGMVLLIALLSGSYISLFIISFQPINAIKGAVKIGKGGTNFKNVLLGLQFTLSLVLIFGTAFIYQQLRHLRTQDLGLNQDRILTIHLYNREAQEKVPLLKDELTRLNGVRHVSASRFIPGQANWHQSVHWEGQLEDKSWNLIEVDEHFIETFDLNLLEGNVENIRTVTSDSELKYVLNQAAVRDAGWNRGYGKPIAIFGSEMVPVSGVVRDFNFKSLHNGMEPCVLVMSANRLKNQVSVKFDTQNFREMMAVVESTFRQVVPAAEFEYSFADEQFDNLYRVESRTGKLIGLLTGMAIVLALLGLYGLLSFTIRERTREIAIRKILGIDLKGIVVLLSRQYVILLLIANVLAIPITWIAINRWLDNFTYRIEPGALTFLVTFAITLLLVLLTVGSKIGQTSRIEPSRTLRSE